MPSEALRGRDRIKGRVAFRSIRKEGKVIRRKETTLFIRRNGSAKSRFGYIVGRRVSDRPVVRNKIKRWLREIFRRNKDRIPVGSDLLIVITGPLSEKTYGEIEENICNLLK